MRAILIVGVVILLSGCATSAQWGNFANARPGYNAQMADDAYQQMLALYPPAKTRLSIDQPVTDPFGTQLLQKLRHGGYAVEEHVPTTGSRSGPATTTTGQPFHYVVDHIGAAGYRVSLRVGGQMLSRAYQVTGMDLAPAGFWAKQQ